MNLLQRKRNLEHPWHVGELCTLTYDERGHGIIYRVVELYMHHQFATVVPVYGVIASTKGRHKRSVSVGYCTPLSLVELATEYTKFGMFIASEANKYENENEPKDDAEPPRDTEAVPPGDNGDVERRQDDDDGVGLCADISARSEQ